MSNFTKVLVTGGSGLVGHAVKLLQPSNFDAVYLSSKDANLVDFTSCYNIFDLYRPDCVIHLAANITYLSKHSSSVGDVFFKNSKINLNVLECCKMFNVERLVSLLSSVMYSTGLSSGVSECEVHTGEPDPANFGYAYAKRMLEVQSRAYNQQYGTKFYCLIPNGIYGPNDNFHIEFSRVIPGIIRKIHEAQINLKKAELWGDGSPVRQFTYSEDVANVIWWCINTYSQNMLFNVSSTELVSIREIAKLVCDVLSFDFENVSWSGHSGSGQKHLPLNCDKIIAESEFKYTPIREGISKTIRWYLNEYPDIRGVAF